MLFSDLKLVKPLLVALDKTGYPSATPIQQQAIPIVLSGSDVFGCAQTGTGKTAAFVLPILQHLYLQKPKKAKAIRSLILAPTRELALQISDSISKYGRQLQISHTTIFGGVKQHRQVHDLQRGVDIVVATPGRLLDLMNQGYVHLNDIEHFVLDEADRMLDMGFINDIKRIISKLPKKKQTLFFSATASPEILKLSASILYNPKHIAVNPIASTAERIAQSVYYVAKEDKRQLLKHLLASNNIDHVLVFSRTKHGADKIVKDLNKDGIRSEAIHGNKSQNARERALKGFKDRSIRVLVATDIAARGIDVDKLSHVINYELPEVAETYVHRIGRTGRAGAEGKALSFCAQEERAYLKGINKLIQQEIEVVASHPFAKSVKTNK